MVLTAIGQICSTASMSHNLAQCQALANKAVTAGAKALFLPEASDYIASSATESVALCQHVKRSIFVQGLQKTAKENNLPINVGIHEPTDPPSKRIKNTLIWIDKDGKIAHRYQKLHLFDIDLRPNGPQIKESDSVEPGKDIVDPYNSIIGKCWIIAAAQCGRHNGKRVSYGDTIVINPNGHIQGRLEKVEDLDGEEENSREPQILIIDIDMNSVKEVRKGIPLLRRTDVYPEL